MNTYKKLLIGLSLLIGLAGLFFLGGKALALSSTDFQNVAYTISPPATISGNIGGSNINFVDSNPFDNDDFLKANYKPQSSQFCATTVYGTPIDSGKGITLLASFDAIVASGGTSFPARIDVDYLDSNGNCATYTASLTFTKQADGSWATAAPGAGGAGGGGTAGEGDDNSQCIEVGNTSLEWILCPITTGIGGLVEQINGWIEDLLTFNVESYLNEGVKEAWAGFRIIATSILVILMLVMIISQAIGKGPFEAYTIKKVLPKVVVAVIAIQLSWELCSWLIGLANDAGNGIADIISAPFNGREALTLNGVLTNLNPAWAVGSNVVVGAGLVGLIILALLTPAGGALLWFFLLVVLSLLVSVMIGIAIIMLRNILIVACVILAPIALVLWILPGTEKYWRFWKSNFTMLLLLFPLIMIIIYTGRIAASIAGDLGFPGILDFIFVLVAFFVPYFILLKAFKWGGGLMAGASSVIAGNKLVKQSQEGIAAAQRRRQKDFVLKNYSPMPEGEEKGDLSRRARFKAALGRGVIRTAGGYPVPTKRATRAMLQEVGEHMGDEVGLETGRINSDYKQALERTGSVGAAKKFIRDKYGYGNMDFDDDGNLKGVKSEYTERAFNNWMIDTKSGMELGDDDWRTDNGTKPDLAKTKGFIAALHADGGRYAQVAQWFPILQPFNQEIGGGPKPADYLSQDQIKEYTGKEAPKHGKRYDSSVDNETGKVIPARRARNYQEAQLFAEDDRFGKWFDNINDTRELGTVRPENYEMMAKVHKGLSDLGLESESSKKLDTLISEAAATHQGQISISPLASGKESARKHINAMFGEGYIESKVGITRGARPATAGGGPEPDDSGSAATTSRSPRPSGGPAGGFAEPAQPGATVAPERTTGPPAGVYPTEGGIGISPDSLSAAAGLTGRPVSSRTLGQEIGKELRKGGVGGEQAPRGDTTIINQGGEVVQNITHESQDSWSRGQVLPPQSSGEALGPANPTPTLGSTPGPRTDYGGVTPDESDAENKTPPGVVPPNQ